MDNVNERIFKSAILAQRQCIRGFPKSIITGKNEKADEEILKLLEKKSMAKIFMMT